MITIAGGIVLGVIILCFLPHLLLLVGSLACLFFMLAIPQIPTMIAVVNSADQNAVSAWMVVGILASISWIVYSLHD